MARYIDADALIFKLKSQDYSCAPDTLEDWTPEDMTRSEISDIEHAPTADVVEVVRCKDCKFYLCSSEKCALIDTRLHFYEMDKRWTDECFCTWGERRTDDDRP